MAIGVQHANLRRLSPREDRRPTHNPISRPDWRDLPNATRTATNATPRGSCAHRPSAASARPAIDEGTHGD